MPHINSTRKAKNMRKNILKERIHEVADHLLIPGYPKIIAGLGTDTSFLLSSST
jgi:hypothetical protein